MAANKSPKASAPTGAKKPPTRGKRVVQPAGSIGLGVDAVVEGPDAAADALAATINSDGGHALARYRDPLFGRPVVFAVLPLAVVQRTVFQRDVSEAHVDKLVDAMKRTGAYLDPVICVRTTAEPIYRSPNGGHRLAALARMGAQCVTALVIPDDKLAFKILALNTEKAHVLKEKALEAVRMLRALAQFGGTGDQLLAFDDVITPLVDELKSRGFDSPGLRNIVLSRIVRLPARGQRLQGTFDEVFDAAIAKAGTFDVSSIGKDDVPAGGASEGADE